MKYHRLIYRDGAVTKQHHLLFNSEALAVKFFAEHLGGNDVFFVNVIEDMDDERKGCHLKSRFGGRFADWVAMLILILMIVLGVFSFHSIGGV